MKIIKEKDQMPVLPEKEGYVAVEKFVNSVSLSIWSAAIGLPLIIVALAVHIVIWQDVLLDSLLSRPIIWLYGIILLSIADIAIMFIFELLHGITWCIIGNIPFNRMRFGFAGNGLVFQCRINSELITKRTYIRGLIIPGLILGFTLTVLGIGINSLVCTIIGSTVLMCSISDIMIAKKIKDESNDSLIYIHPQEAGCFVYHKCDE
jgi:hypothetical protein